MRRPLTTLLTGIVGCLVAGSTPAMATITTMTPATHSKWTATPTQIRSYGVGITFDAASDDEVEAAHDIQVSSSRAFTTIRRHVVSTWDGSGYGGWSAFYPGKYYWRVKNLVSTDVSATNTFTIKAPKRTRFTKKMARSFARRGAINSDDAYHVEMVRNTCRKLAKRASSVRYRCHVAYLTDWQSRAYIGTITVSWRVKYNVAMSATAHFKGKRVVQSCVNGASIDRCWRKRRWKYKQEF